VTGGAGFIGSNLITKLNSENFNDIVVVDSFENKNKLANLKGKKLSTQIDRDDFFDWLNQNNEMVEFIFHLGAKTDTTLTDNSVFDKYNLNYTKEIWKACCKYQIPLIYASSAATYGDGSLGYSDDHRTIHKLKPLNLYGWSKHNFDLWALGQEEKPFFWAGLKFFNAYGPNEGHKGKMASMIHQAFKQIRKTGELQLFKSYNKNYEHGEQKRDFIHVNDIVDTIYWLMHHRKNSGIYNLGTGKARSFNAMALEVFSALKKEPNIKYIEIPDSIRDKYQYFTQAEMGKIKSIMGKEKGYEFEVNQRDFMP